MAGYELSAESIIIGIRNNLEFWYKSDYAVIKELIQNADDARATRLELGWSRGFTEADHPLLRGPAVFVLNDGPFDYTHARAIHQFAVGNKGSDRTKIGKFGLGLKSIFHLCEAFFYLSNADPRVPRRPSVDRYERSDVLNPWQAGTESRHPDWEGFSEKSRRLILDFLEPLLPRPGSGTLKYRESWFCLWLPLRRLEQCGSEKWAIEPNFPGDPKLPQAGLVPPPTIFSDHLATDVVQMLPLLQSLTLLRVWTTGHGGELLLTDRVELVPSRRLGLLGEERPGNEPLEGTCRLERPIRKLSLSVRFAGREARLPAEDFVDLKQSKNWPWTDTLTAEGMDRLPAKAEPHAAILINDHASSGTGSLALRWAVFLPLGDKPAEVIDAPGAWDFHVTFHGYFFVDAGRLGVKFAPNGADGADRNDSQAKVQELWNTRLVDRGTFNLLIPALNAYARGTPDRAERTAKVRLLVEALSKSDLFREHRATICSQFQWLPRLTKDGLEWCHVAADQDVFPLPAVLAERWAQTRTLFPRLAALTGQYCLVRNDWPGLRQNDVFAPWPSELVLSLLAVDPLALFADADQLGLLTTTLTSLGQVVADNPLVLDRLREVARAGLLGVPSTQLRRNAEQISELLKLLPPSSMFSVRHSGELVSESERIACELAGLNLTILPVSERLLPPTFEKHPLSSADATAMLRCIGALRPAGRQRDEFHALKTRVAVDVLNLAGRDAAERNGVVEACKDLILFPCYDYRCQERTLFSIRQLQSLHQQHAVFSNSQLCRPLQKALPGRQIVFIQQSEVTDLLSALGTEVPGCYDADALECIWNATPAEMALPPDRSDMLTALVALLGRQPTPEISTRIRYFLHAHREEAEIDLAAKPRLIRADPVADGLWYVFARAFLDGLGQTWRLVDATLVRCIPEQHAEKLGLVGITPDQVAEIGAELVRRGSLSLRLDRELLQRHPDRRLSLIREWPARHLGVLRALPVHETMDGGLVSIDANTVSQGPYHAPAALIAGLTILRLYREDRMLAARQEELAPPLRLDVLVGKILDGAQSHHQWRWILDSLPELVGPSSTSMTLGDKLRDRPWLPLNNDQAVAPSAVLRLSDVEAAIGPLLRVGVSFVHEGMLVPEVLEHANRSTLSRLFPTKDKSLERLAAAMSGREECTIGPLSPDAAFISDLVEIVVEYEEGRKALPSVTLLAAVMQGAGRDQALAIARQLARPLSADRLAAVLNYLSGQHEAVLREDQLRVLKLFAHFLRQAAGNRDCQGILAEIRLLTQRREWKPADQIVFLGHNVDASCLLHEDLWGILDGVCEKPRDNVPLPEKITGGPNGITVDLVDQRIREGVRELDEYLQLWRSEVPGDLIAVVLSLLGDHESITDLYTRYREHVDRPTLRRRFGWAPGPAGQSMDIAMARHAFLIEPSDGRMVETVNLLGQRVQVTASQEVQCLFDGFDGMTYWDLGDGRRLHRLRLRKVSPLDLTPERRLEVLRETTRVLLRVLYRQPAADLDDLWTKLSRSEQLDLQIAQNLILEASPFYLRGQLGLRPRGKLKSLFEQWDRARHHVATADYLLQQGQGLTEEKYEAELELSEARSQLRELLTGDSETQLQVLQALQGRVTQFSYQSTAVAFELIQNADDSVVELARLLGPEGQMPALSSRVVIEHDVGTLRLAHWGRAINRFQSGSYDGREAGFDRDLEKMLVLSSSDKFPTPGQESTTGKFGLGFKSVFLITNTPCVFSGQKSRFRVVAGVFPEPLEPELEQSMQQWLKAQDDTRGEGTLIELPLVEQDISAPANLLGPLIDVMAYLVVFTRRIKQVHVLLPDENRVRASWSPSTVNSIQGMEIGTLSPGAKGIPPRALAFRHDGAVVLLGLGPQGFLPLPDEVPSVWVTAPTTHRWRVGVLVQGNFDLDVGRTQLADSADNRCIAEQLAAAWGQGLCELAEFSTEWERFSHILGLAAGLDPYEFWLSLWDACLQRASRITDRGPGLVRQVLGGGPLAGVRRLCTEHAVVPTKLAAPFRVLTQWDKVRWMPEGCLSHPEVFSATSQWRWFASTIRVGEIAAREIADAIETFEPGRRVQRLTLYDVVTGQLDGRSQVDPETADELGLLIHQPFLLELAHSKYGNPGDEYDRLLALLQTLQFRNADGAWATARDLLMGHGGEDADTDRRDELMRAAFAPAASVLSDLYTVHGMAFFRACRGPMTAKAKEMAEWAIAASGDPRKQDAVLDYLIKGKQSREFAAALDGSTVGTWLADISSDSPAMGRFDEYQRAILSGQLKRREVMGGSAPTPPSPSAPTADPATVLRAIHGWWSRNREELTARYEKSAYPGGPTRLSDEGIGEAPESRRGWMILLALGAMHTMGRVTIHQNRGFLDYCQARGWLDTICAPPQGGEGLGPWAGIFQSYLEDQVEEQDYFFWMGQFLSLYQLSRWLPVYVRSFLSMGRLRSVAEYPAVDLTHFTRLRSSPVFEGSTGFDAPPVSRTLGSGACFVVRELVRRALLPQDDPRLWPHCYVPSRRVRLLVSRITGENLVQDQNGTQPWERSQRIYQVLLRYLPRDMIHFGHAFDLPFLILTQPAHADTAARLAGAEAVASDDPTYVPMPDDETVY